MRSVELRYGRCDPISSGKLGWGLLRHGTADAVWYVRLSSVLMRKGRHGTARWGMLKFEYVMVGQVRCGKRGKSYSTNYHFNSA